MQYAREHMQRTLSPPGQCRQASDKRFVQEQHVWRVDGGPRACNVLDAERAVLQWPRLRRVEVELGEVNLAPLCVAVAANQHLLLLGALQDPVWGVFRSVCQILW